MAYNLESLLKILHQILHPHPHPRIQLDSEQKLLLESLLEKANSLNQVFENPTGGLTTHGIEDLELRITDAAYDAEDVIESHLANHLLLWSSDIRVGSYYIDLLFSSPNDAEDVIQSHQILMICPLDLQRVIQKFNLINEEITKIHTTPGPGASSSSLPVSSPMGPNPRNIVVGIDDDLLQLKDKLTGYPLNVEVIFIVGMEGIGKTTLAQNLYNDRLIVSHFDMRAWITISQEYNMQRILLDLLQSFIRKHIAELMEKDNEELAFMLYRTLYGRTYLIVLDNINSEDWHSMERFFPADHNGSRVVVTTRELIVAKYVGSYCHQMKFLDDVESWNLLRMKIFGEERCPPELERIGHVIAQGFKGVPLGIHFISGILTKLPITQEAWEEVSKDVSLAITNTDDYVTKIMALGYNVLPSHLKPCFLFMAAFPEDFKIRTSKLVRLWVAEGFLKPIVQYENLEDVGKVYLKALADRNLILVCEQSEIKDNVKSYMMHDVTRKLCIRKAREENFCHRISVQNQVEGLSSLHRIIEEGVIHVETGREIAILPRTFLLFDNHSSEWNGISGLRLLRVLDILKIQFKKFPEEILKLINLRYLAVSFIGMITVPISVLCNLQTICFSLYGGSWTDKELFEIFMIPQLRHLIFKQQYPKFYLHPGRSLTTQEDLQTLSNVILNSFLQNLLVTTPNLKKLGIISDAAEELSNVDLTCLSKLETLKCVGECCVFDLGFLSRVIFPPSLKKLTLESCVIKEEDLNDIAMLPNLQVLKLVDCNFVSEIWEPLEGGFDRLNFLLLQDLFNLKKWTANETHYPRLVHLTIRDCWNLEKIPIYLGDIPTLELIEMEGKCTTSAVESARIILQEQLGLGNDGLQVRTPIYK